MLLFLGHFSGIFQGKAKKVNLVKMFLNTGFAVLTFEVK